MRSFCCAWTENSESKLSSSCRWEQSHHVLCCSLQPWTKLNIRLTCWVSWEPFVGASDDLWPLSFATERVRRRVWGTCAVAMATFTLPWDGHSTIPSAGVDPLCSQSLSQHPTGGAGRSRARHPAARKQISYHPHDPCHTTVWKKSNGPKHMAIVFNFKAHFQEVMHERTRHMMSWLWSICRARTPSSVGLSGRKCMHTNYLLSVWVWMSVCRLKKRFF